MNGSKPLMARQTSIGLLSAGKPARRLPSPRLRGRSPLRRAKVRPSPSGSPFPRWNDPGRIGFAIRWIAFLPLPEGEGRGEGKRDSGPAALFHHCWNRALVAKPASEESGAVKREAPMPVRRQHINPNS